MAETHELIQYSKQFPVKLLYQRLGHTSRHWHSSIELLFVLSGELHVTVEDQTWTLKPDDLILINPNHIHETRGDGCILVALQMKLSSFHLDWLDCENLYFECNSALSSDKSAFYPIKKILAHMIHINSQSSQENLLINYSHAFSLIHELFHFSSVSQKEKGKRSKMSMERLHNIITYIDEHYKENLTLTFMAEKEHLSPTYFSHFFQDHMGVSFSNYLTKIRLEHSLNDLLYTDATIDQIAENNGFPNARSYAKLFSKEYSQLPSTYRKERAGAQLQSQKLAPASQEAINYLELEHFDYFDKLAEYLRDGPIDIAEGAALHTDKVSLGTINVNQTSAHLSHTFKRFCAVGRAKELLYGDVQEMLRTLQKEIGFQYIKFHGLFDDQLDVFSMQNGKPVLNFYYLDRVFDFLLSVGLKPVVQFSFMPKDLAKTPENQIFHHPFIISEPNDDKLWWYLVSSTVEHFVERYGFSEVKSWIFTFWNETMSHFIFDFDSIDTFFRLYEITWHAVKTISSEFTFTSTTFTGSPSDLSVYEHFLDFCSEHSCPPDGYLFNFYSISDNTASDMSQLSTNQYNDEHFKRNLLVLDTNPRALDDYISHVKKNLPPKSKIYLTEWNLSPSHREWLNDTCFSSAYFVRNILANYDQLECFCHWSLTDWIEELPFHNNTFHGGMGFFTRNKIKKPVFHAYWFLSQLKDELIAQGENYFITKGEDGYAIILYHYVHFSSLYAQGITFNTTFTERYHSFDFASPKQLEFALDHLTDGTYSITERIVNRKYGSAFDKWLEMGGMEPETPEDVRALEQLSAPMLKKRCVTVSNGILPISAILDPLEIRLIEIKRKR